MKQILELFNTRLHTLSALIDQATSHFGADEFLTFRLIDDMHPLGTQIVFTCNQPHNFAQWVNGEEVSNLDPNVETATEAKHLVKTIQTAISLIDIQQAFMPKGKRLDFGPERYVELSGSEYVNDFLIPNFYFHLVTTYDILRANGVQIGKVNYMAHLLGRIKRRTDT